jgi:putative DNA primase/helicase
MLSAEQTYAALATLRSAGLLLDTVEFDGALHRVATTDKPNGKDAAYIAHADAPISIWWQNWRSGESGTWTAKGQDKLTKAERDIILAADNDCETDGNLGLAKATAAAIAVDGSLAVPHHEGRKCDWNDLHRLMEDGEVRTQLMNHAKPEPPNGAATDKQSELSAPRLHCVNAFDFLSMSFPERDMLLSPILPRQGLCMLHAMRGIGKTFISLSVAYAVASGGKVFDRWGAPRPASVLFLDGEMPARTLQERLASLVAGSEHEPPDNDYLRILTPDMQDGPMPNLATREGQEAIEPLLEGADLVVLDNLATLARHGRSNDEESWIPVQGWLLGLRRRGIYVLMIHHQGKGGDQRGTSAKEDILDTVIRLDRPKDYRSEQGARFEVHLTKARGICGVDAKPFEAQLFTEGQALTWTTRAIEEAELDQLRQLLSEGFSIRDAAVEMGISKSAAGRLKRKLDALEADARISQGTSFYSSLEACHEQ